MYVAAINGSPRKEGNTKYLLKSALKPLEEAGWETEIIQAGGRKIRGCTACNKCWENKDQKCILTDDDFNEIMEKIIRADAIIVGSPTYFAGIAAEVKGIVERAGYVGLANGGLLRGKIGTAVTAVRRGGATHVFDTVNHMFLMSQMIVPGSTYWNIGIGHDKGDVAEDAEGLANMDNLGKTIDWLAKCMKPHMDSFPKPE